MSERFGPYEILGELAAGAQGVVLKAQRDGRLVALKLLRKATPKTIAHFEQEGRILAQLRHPNLPFVAELGREGGLPYLAMEFVQGEDLRAYVNRVGVPPFEWTAGVLQPVAHALHHCHLQGVVHRDVKPANVVLEAHSGRAVLVDFGMLKRVERTLDLRSLEDAAVLLTKTGEIKGTPTTMAPEQISSERFGPVSPRTDVYALGATLYVLLTGEGPFAGDALAQVLAQILGGDVPDPRQLSPRLPAALAELCLRCLAKAPAERPESALAFANALADAAGVARLPMQAPTHADRAPPSTHPNPELATRADVPPQAPAALTAKTIGPYHVLAELGRGGMGAVYRARDGAGRDVALKVATRPDRAVTRERFAREGALTAALRHPGIIQVHAAGEAADCLYIAYELVESARSFAEATAALDLTGRVSLTRDAALALGHAHTHGVVHRDVKPDNLLVDTQGAVKVADFGLATARDLERLTRTGAYVGTPMYMAPEQIDGKRAEPSPATDVWALGVVLYEALCGQLPFRGENVMEQMLLISEPEANWVAPSKRAEDLPTALDAVCAKALRKDPRARYPDGGALAADLDRFLRGEPVEARPPRGPLPMVLASLASVATLLLLAIALILRGQREELPTPPAQLPVAPVTARSNTPSKPATRREARAELAKLWNKPITTVDARAWARRFDTLPDAHALFLKASVRAGPAPLPGRHSASGARIFLSPQGALLTHSAFGRDGVVRWDLARGRLPGEPLWGLRSVERPLAMPGGLYFAGVRGSKGTLYTATEFYLHPLGDGLPPQPLRLPPSPGGKLESGFEPELQTVALSPGGELLVAGYVDGWLQGIRFGGDALEHVWAARKHDNPVVSARFAAGGVLITTGGATEEAATGGKIIAWDPEQGIELDRVPLGGKATLLDLAPDRLTFAVGIQASYKVNVYRLEGRAIRPVRELIGVGTRDRFGNGELSALDSPPRAGAFSADGLRLYVSGGDVATRLAELRGWTLDSGDELFQTSSLPFNSIASLVLSEEGALIFSGERDGKECFLNAWQLELPR